MPIAAAIGAITKLTPNSKPRSRAPAGRKGEDEGHAEREGAEEEHHEFAPTSVRGEGCAADERRAVAGLDQHEGSEEHSGAGEEQIV